MTTALHHGAPGSFKTFAITQRVIIPELYKGRVVITNIRGLDCLDTIEKTIGKPMPETAKIISVPHDKKGFDSIARFFQWAPMGALIVIDEVQRVYSRATKSLDQFSFVYDGDNPDQPETVADAFDKHRHMNWDIYLSTTHIKKVHSEVREVCEWAYRHRDQTGLLPWYKNTWKEFRHDAESTGKSASNIDLATKYEANPEIFKCYKSTATGEAKKSHIKRTVFGDRRVQLYGIFFLLLLTYVGSKVSTIMDRFEKSSEEIVEVHAKKIPSIAKPPDNISNAVVSDEVDSKTIFNVNPFANAKIYYTGSINYKSIFSVEFDDGRRLSLHDDDLKLLGFKVNVIRPCFVLLEFNNLRTMHTCRPEIDFEPEDEKLAVF